MNRPKYKEMYFKYKAENLYYKDSFNTLIRLLKDFDLDVIDKITQSPHRFGNVREIYIFQGDKHKIQILIPEEYL